MAPQKRKGRLMGLLKCLVLVITCLSFFGVLSCNNSGTSSTTSSAGGSGTGTGWTITITIGANSIPLNGETSVLAIVKDSTGAPAPYGTNICFTAIRGDFLLAGQAEGYATICETTTNNLGQSIQTYRGTETGEDSIHVSSQNLIATAAITVY